MQESTIVLAFRGTDLDLYRLVNKLDPTFQSPFLPGITQDVWIVLNFLTSGEIRIQSVDRKPPK